jgi:hypothetical protein
MLKADESDEEVRTFSILHLVCHRKQSEERAHATALVSQRHQSVNTSFDTAIDTCTVFIMQSQQI